MSSAEVVIAPVSGKADLGTFIDLAYAINASDPNWVPPLRAEVIELLSPGKNPFHEHAKVQLFLARRGGKVVGRISAHYDELALAQPPELGMGPGTGNWGLFEAADEAVAQALRGEEEVPEGLGRGVERPRPREFHRPFKRRAGTGASQCPPIRNGRTGQT